MPRRGRSTKFSTAVLNLVQLYLYTGGRYRTTAVKRTYILFTAGEVQTPSRSTRMPTWDLLAVDLQL